jgi:hypothetical protein
MSELGVELGELCTSYDTDNESFVFTP